MNLFKRQNLNKIEGIDIDELDYILCGIQDADAPSVDSIVFDTIVLSDCTIIQCIDNYYTNQLGETPKKKRGSKNCPAIQKLYGVRSMPYECSTCHREMIHLRRVGQVKKIK